MSITYTEVFGSIPLHMAETDSQLIGYLLKH
jgi:hypothetical protein